MYLCISSAQFFGILSAACSIMRGTTKLEVLNLKAQLITSCNMFCEQSSSSHHVTVEGTGVGIHHEQQLLYGLMEWRDEPPHHSIQVLKLPLPIGHLTHHRTQRCPLQRKQGKRFKEVVGKKCVCSWVLFPVKEVVFLFFFLFLFFLPEQPRRPTPTHHQGLLYER